MDEQDFFSRNRVILSHYDSYSTALVFARREGSVLFPGPLPEGAEPCEPAVQADEVYAAETARSLACARYGLKAEHVVHMPGFNEWMHTPAGPLRVHLLRFETFEAPHEAVAPHDAVFKSISELRGTAMIELNLLRRVFNLIIGGG